MKFENYNDENSINEFHSKFEEQSTHISAINSLLVGEELSQSEVSSLKESKIVNDFLELPLNDVRESELKKIFAAAITIAEEKGLLDSIELKDKSPVAIASLVDDGLTRLKVGYQTANGVLDVIEASETLIDRYTARVITVVEKVIEKGIPIVFGFLTKSLVKVYPTAVTLVPFIAIAEKFLTDNAKKIARKGIEIISNTAKKAVRKVAETAQKVGKKLLTLFQ